MHNFIPSKEECKQLKIEVSNFLNLFKGEKEVKFFVGGSYAKDTWLPGNKEVDIFAKFDYKKFVNEDISLKLFDLLSKRFKDIETIHGSRDYYHIIHNDLLFEIVPVLDIGKGKEAKNLMDYSPLHVAYIKKKLKRKDDVRKLKTLLKAQHMYGAESYINGFSGYVLELLVSYYGSFDKLIKNVRKSWNEDGIYLDAAKHYSSKSIALRCLNQSKIGPLLLIDPVDKERNAAASVSSTKYKQFLKLCKEYDNSPKWFVPKIFDVSRLNKEYIILNVKPLDGKQDVVLAKMNALIERFVRELKLNGFEVLDYGWDPEHYWFRVGKLDKKYKHYGPSVSMEDHVLAFKKKHGAKNVKISKGRCFVELNRKYYEPKKFIQSLIREEFVKEKVKNISL